jgi:glycosyltransferase involved in cell wall biosynthesis
MFVGRSLGHIARMISVIVPTHNSEVELPRCFDSLIGATVHGLVREVIVTDGGSTDGTLAIADAAGAHVVTGVKGGRGAQLMQAAKSARGDWLLFLHPETALEASWEAEAESFLSRTTLERPYAASFRFGLDDFGSAARRAEIGAAMRCALLGMPRGNQGLLISKRHYQKLGGHRAVALEDVDLVRRIGRRRLVMLRARAINKATPRGRIAAVWSLALLCLHALRVPSGVLRHW